MVVGVCGYSYTGSGAVVDFLKEFDETNYCYDGEFLFPYYPDGLQDLKYHLTEDYTKYASGHVAIERYKRLVYIFIAYLGKMSDDKKKNIMKLTDDYLGKLTQVTWKGYGAADIILSYGSKRQFIIRETIDRALNLIYRKVPLFENTSLYPMRDINLSITPENFDSLTKEYIKEILKVNNLNEEKITVLDQPFSVNNPTMSFSFFDNPIAIVVDRDPRDLYLFAKYFLGNKARQIPTETVEQFVNYYRQIHMTNNPNDNRIVRIRFEDMIYEYDKTSELLKEKLSLKKHHLEKQIFNPAMSVSNTNLESKMQFKKEDLEYIKRELSEYLYPFEKYNFENTGKMFA